MWIYAFMVIFVIYYAGELAVVLSDTLEITTQYAKIITMSNFMLFDHHGS